LTHQLCKKFRKIANQPGASELALNLLQNIAPRNPEADQATNSAQKSSQFSEIFLEKL